MSLDSLQTWNLYRWLSEWVGFNVSLNAEQLISDSLCPWLGQNKSLGISTFSARNFVMRRVWKYDRACSFVLSNIFRALSKVYQIKMYIVLLAMAVFAVCLLCFWCMWCFVSLVLVVSTSTIDCLERVVSKMTYYVSNGTLNVTHSNDVSGSWYVSKADDRRTIKSPDFIGRFSRRN